MAHGIPARLTSAQGRRFGLTVGGAFLVLAALAWWRGRLTAAVVTGSLGGTLTLAGLLVPQWLGPVEKGWTALAHAISKVTTPIFLGIIYFVVLAPAGLIMRAFGRHPLSPERAQPSFWVSRGQQTRGDLHRQF